MNSKPAYRALVVDDETQVRALTSRALRQEGFSCDPAADGLEAQQKLGQQRYDVMVTDLRMPRFHGHKLITEVLENPHPPLVVVLTAVAEPKIVEDLYQRGVDDIAFKPVTYPAFAIKVRLMLERRTRGRMEAPAVKPVTPSISTAKTDVKRQINEATQTLRDQLNDVTQNFRSTISELEKMESGFVGSVRVLSNLINQVGQFKGSHAARVESLSVRLGEACGLSREDLRNLTVAALLHDIGQFGMPDNVRILPPHSLAPEERAIFHSYPSIGAALLSEVAGAEQVVELIETHAENYDGTGFPQQLRGEQIPLGARIIRLADGFDNFMVFEGNAGDPWDNARHHLTSYKGVFYDPLLVDQALKFSDELEYDSKDENIKAIPARDLLIGHVLAQNVYDRNGRFLARKGAEVSGAMLPRLQRLAGNQTVKIRIRPGSEDTEEESGE